MKGIYLASFTALHPNYNIVYQDINGLRDLPGDMMNIDLTPYDFIIATPPCNYWSRANYRRNTSEYSLKTKHLLPDIIDKLSKCNKPFIIENVRNDKMFNEYKLFDYKLNVYKIGRHTYWTNVKIEKTFNQKAKTDFLNGKKRYLSSQNLPRDKRQGGEDVHVVIEEFLRIIHERN